MEVGSYRHESDDPAELFDDFAALPEQFRPKKTFKSDLKSPTVVPKIPIQKESCLDSRKTSDPAAPLSKPIEKSPGVSKPVVGNGGKKDLKSRPTSLPPNHLRQPPQLDAASDHHQLKSVPRKDDRTVKRNPVRRELTLSKRFSEMSVETIHFPEDVKVKKTVWSNDLVFETEPEIWKFNGSTLVPEKPVSTSSVKRATEEKKGANKSVPRRERNVQGRGAGSKKKNNCGWNDDLDLFVDKKVNFGYISKETKNGSSTITACWGDMHQTRPFVRPPKQNLQPGNRSRDRPQKTPKHENDAKQYPVKEQPAVDKRKQRRSKNVHTTIIRHEIKVVHVNATDVKSVPSNNSMSLEKLVLSKCPDRLFAFGTKAGLEDSQFFHSGLDVPKPKKEDLPEKVAVGDKSLSKDSKNDNQREETQKALEESRVIRRSSFLGFGRDIYELVAGCHVARSVLVATHEDWVPVRNKTIELMETLAENVSCTQRKNRGVQRAVDFIQSGSKMACAIPNIKISIVAKIIAAITPFISMLFKSSPSITQTGVTETEMMNQIQDDIEATLEMYFFGIQCHHQFREANELFEKFQSFIDANDFSDFAAPEADFVRDVSFFSPKNSEVYYRRLHKAFLKLYGNRTSDVSKTFCRDFEDNPQEIGTVQYLYWGFPAQIEDCEAFQRAWKEVSRVLESSDSSTEVLEEIRDCIHILRKERRTIENNLAELSKNIV